MDSPLLKYSAKDYFFKAALCHFCIDMLNAKVSAAPPGASPSSQWPPWSPGSVIRPRPLLAKGEPLPHVWCLQSAVGRTGWHASFSLACFCSCCHAPGLRSF